MKVGGNIGVCLRKYVSFLRETTLFQAAPGHRKVFLSDLKRNDVNPSFLKLATPKINPYEVMDSAVSLLKAGLLRNAVLTRPEGTAHEMAQCLSSSSPTRLQVLTLESLSEQTPFNTRFEEYNLLKQEVLELLTTEESNGIRTTNQEDFMQALGSLPNDEARELLKGFLATSLRDHNSFCLVRDPRASRARKKQIAFVSEGLSNLPKWLKLITVLDPETLDK